ncbi:DM DNA binding domain-containing protein [Ditylenchus destructor]|uniref:DM DNA binding domain-containing protein n=1 Tax=Ditylenchus destructor TaxID=166010 RepID=A0AAD4NC88_9BILA|nr:DM DNA binding domain-containing protein [Ditylenchus destructor]
MSPIPRHKRCCTLCKNHDQENETRGHKCKYKTCPCIMCEKSRLRQSFMSQEIRVAREEQKGSKRIPNEIRRQNPHAGRRGPYKCQRCRHHEKVDVEKKGHKCEWATCTCNSCIIAVNRRAIDHDLKDLRSSVDNPAQEQCNNTNDLSDNGQLSAFTPVNSHTLPASSESTMEDQMPNEEVCLMQQLDGMEITSPPNTSLQLQPGLTSVSMENANDIPAPQQLLINANQIALPTAVQTLESNSICTLAVLQAIQNQFSQNLPSLQMTAGNNVPNSPYIGDVLQFCANPLITVSPDNSGLCLQTYLFQPQYANNFLQVQGDPSPFASMPSAFQRVPSECPYYSEHFSEILKQLLYLQFQSTN